MDFLYIDRENPASADLVSLLGVRYQPEFYFATADGTVVDTAKGPLSADELRIRLDSLLAGP